MELPIAFENRMKELLGEEYEAFFEALSGETAVKGLRVNTGKLSVGEFVKNAPFALSPIAYVPNGFIVSEEDGAGKHPAHHAGAYYMQDPGAMATVAALPEELWREGIKVLDLCAAPGGKTTQLASRAEELGGAVLANEYNAARSRILAGNIERMGLKNVCVTNLDSRVLADLYPAFFDLTVVDAPCSGEGMYRKNDRAVTEWSVENVRACALRQKEILDNAAVCVAPSGYLLYSTCTYATEENEETVADFLDRHPDFSLLPCHPSVLPYTADGIDVTGGKRSELALCRRFYPHRAKGEGQFVALLQRAADAVDNKKRSKNAIKDGFRTLSAPDAKAVSDFLCETVGHEVSGLGLCGGNAVSFAVRERMEFPIPPHGVVALGVAIGEVRKGRIVPHHHFFMAYGNECSSQCLLDADGELVWRYLAGEEIETAADAAGYTAVLLRHGEARLTLGGGKSVGGRLKNYYPKGLRVARH